MGIIERQDLLAVYYAGNSREQTKYRHEYSLVEVKKRERDLSPLLKKLPADTLRFLEIAGDLAEKYQLRLYLVGGQVRDIFLKVENRDLDLVLEGDLESYIRELADVFKVQYIYNAQFRTGNLVLPCGLNIDLAGLRRESYRYSGALPDVEPAEDILEDLFRRDYTVNSLVLSLNKAEWGLLLDFFNGLEDLQEGKLRLLHPFSFLDDPIRIIRGIRLAVKTGFTFEEESFALLEEVLTKADFSRLSLDRVLKEMELLFASPVDPALVALLRSYPVFRLLKLELEIDEKLTEQARELESYLAEFGEKNYNIEEWVMRMALFLADAGEGVLNWKVRSDFKEIFLAYYRYKHLLVELDRNLAADELAAKLKGLRDEELLILLVKAGSRRIKENILRYMKELKDIELKINGRDLLANGLEPGPLIREILDEVYRKRLKGSLDTREEQLAYARDLIRKSGENKE
ncbi:MAG: CCA tRNA nucleotidyltransferase [Halanaerobiaceae bacterium]|nr:CCA tRNA nucleotidyltransferase [Halanaerobiaceae bacterium]